MMSSEEIVEHLGLSKDDRVELAAEVSVERADVGFGFSAGEPVWNALEPGAHFREVELGAPIELLEWEECAGVFSVRLAASGRLRVVTGNARKPEESTALVDARHAGALLHVELDRGDEVVLELRQDACRYFRVERLLPIPAPEHFTRNQAIEAWLVAEYRSSASTESCHERLAAVGSILRLWRPVTPAGRKELLDETLRSGSPVVRDVREWVNGLPAMMLRRAEALAVFAAETLEDDLDAVDAAFERGDEWAREFVTSLALSRDRLESTLAILRLQGEAQVLTLALERLDEHAALYLSQMASTGVYDRRLERASQVEPLVWWNAVVTGEP